MAECGEFSELIAGVNGRVRDLLAENHELRMWWDDPAAVKARLAELELREPRTKGVRGQAPGVGRLGGSGGSPDSGFRRVVVP
jgi:hypothetical protein